MRPTVDVECQRIEKTATPSRGSTREFWRMIHKLSEFTRAEFEALKRDFFSRGGTITLCPPGMRSHMTSISYGRSRWQLAQTNALERP